MAKLTLLGLLLLGRIALAQDNSAVFSQFLGAPTVSATFDGASSALQSQQFTLCTNFVHGLQALPTLAAVTSIVPRLKQQQVDGVCQFCTSISQSRVDSCCGQASSVACFYQFAPGGAASQTTSGGTAPVTGAAATPTGSESMSAAASTSSKSSGGERVNGLTGSLAAAMFGLIPWLI